jgi:hypothetical protein
VKKIVLLAALLGSTAAHATIPYAALLDFPAPDFRATVALCTDVARGFDGDFDSYADDVNVHFVGTALARFEFIKCMSIAGAPITITGE